MCSFFKKGTNSLWSKTKSLEDLKQEMLQKLRSVDPVQLVYEHRPNYVYPHFVMMKPGTYNHEYYADAFRTKKRFSERLMWCEENIGPGSQLSAGQYLGQTWFAFEWGEKWGPHPPYRYSIASEARDERELLDPGGAAVCFLREKDALLFKMRWG